MKIKTTIALLVLAFSLTQCKKDLTSGIVGKYVNTRDDYDIIVNKIDESTVSIVIDDDLVFNSAKMNSKTTFTLNTVTETDGTLSYTLSGSGSVSGNNIIIQMNYSDSDGDQGTETLTGTK